MAEFVYQMYKARKAVGEKVILDDVTVGVYPGAKIGVVGPNGMGKSTLLKVIAGMEDVSNGEAKPLACFSRSRRWMRPKRSRRTSSLPLVTCLPRLRASTRLALRWAILTPILTP